MDKRNHQREEMVDVLPADKRVCSTSEYKSDSLNLPAPADIVSKNSGPEHLELDMEASSSLSERDREDDSSQGEMVENSLSYNQPDLTNDDAPSHSDDLSYSATSRNRGYLDAREHYDPNSSSLFGPNKGHLKKICSSLKLVSSLDIQLANLTELCDVLSLCTEDSISFSCTESLVPTLIGLAKHDNPEIMLLAIRAFTHICNIMPLSSLFISRHDVVPTLCARLMVIEYIDVAEQCLQALEKISHDHAVVCLRNGAIMAALMYIDFFPTTVQRVALSAVATICKRLPSDSFSSIKDAVPILSNLLHNEDQKIVESAVTCLVNIIRCFSSSNDMLDELCKPGLLQQATDAISINSQMVLNRQAFTGLIGMLSMVACGSAVAAEALLDMNIISTLRDILSTCRFSCGAAYSLAGDVYSDQICAVLNLLNVLLPPLEGETTQMLCCKENKFKDQPGLLQYGMDILPVLIHVGGSGANLSLCYGSLLVMNKLVHYSTSDMLQDMLTNKNMCSFLTGVIALKDHHVLIPVLRLIDNLMQKLPKVYVQLFVKEGVVAAVDMLLLPEACLNEKHKVNKPNSSIRRAISVLKTVSNDDRKCLCASFSAHHTPSSRGICKLDKEMVCTLAKHIKETYFPLEVQISGAGLTEKLQRMKALCKNLSEQSCLDDSVTDHKLYLNDILERLMVELKEGDPLSTFEFIESGIIKSLTNYLGCGKDLKEKIVDHNLLDYFGKVQRRFIFFAQLAFASTSGQWRDLSSAVIVDKLLSALSTLENLPVVHVDRPKSRGSYADIPGRYTSYPCLKVCFMKDVEDKYFHEYSSNVVTVELLASMDAVEDYLWPLISKNGRHSESTNQYMPDKEKVHTPATEDCSNVSSDLLGPQSCVSRTPSVSSETTHTMEYVSMSDNGVALRQTVEAGTASEDASRSKECAANIRDSTEFDKEYAPSKLDFFFQGKLLDRSVTLYQAILQQLMQENALSSTRLWNEVFHISFKRSLQSETRNCGQEFIHVLANWIQKGVPSIRKSKMEFPAEFGMPDPICDVLFLLQTIERLNRSSFHLMSYEREESFPEGNLGTLNAFEVSTPAIPQSEFVSSKLTEKLEQQMHDPFCVDSRCLPSWCNQLVSEFPFLFSFEARRKYFQLCLSGFLRSKCRSLSQHGSTNNANISNERSHASTVPKKKFQVQRDCILDSALKMMDGHARDEAILEVEFAGEVGTGLGPTLEFYILVSREFQKTSINMWRGTNYNWSPTNREGFEVEDFISPPHGLFPRPWSLDALHSTDFSEVEKKFLLLGQVVARALQDGRMLDLPFSKAFLRLVLGQDLDLYDIKSFDPELGKAMEELQAIVGRKKFLDTVGSGHEVTADLQLGGSKIVDLCLDFTLPGYPDYVLKGGAEHELVSLDCLGEYVSLVVDATVKSGIGRQVEAFKSGFNEVFPIHHLQIFREDELDRMLCGEQEAWVSEAFLDHVKFDHGYTSSSLPVIHFLEIVREFKHEERSAFLQFVTGAPRLPPGGLAALNPKLTIVRKNSGSNADWDLPSVMTCANYLKLPPYSTKERARERLLYAITEGQGSFHLS
ncbi:E3 ubiquitin-protein ligase UPL4 [Nymphaea colorata]|nr:E3 ubiquitin-protein ligase UPL4 [Nymphaea colorata]